MKSWLTTCLQTLAVSFLSCLLITSCGSKGREVFSEQDVTEEREAFWAFYNQKVLENLQAELTELKSRLEPLQSKSELSKEEAAERSEMEAQLTQVQERLKSPEFFTFAKPEDWPEDSITWENGLDHPEIGDPKAKKGGQIRNFIPSYPPNIRTFGSNSNNFFRGYHYDDVEMGLITLHPDMIEPTIIPAIAHRWGVSEDHRTVYFEINPKATYSDGVPIESDDFFNTFFLQLSEYAQNPYGNYFYANEFVNITKYDKHRLSVTLPKAKPLTPYFCNLIPMPRHYYQEFGPDFETRYQWRSRPTAGAYQILEDGIVHGRTITLSRVKDWWAKNLKYYQYRFNPDQYIYRVIRTPEKAFELFKTGQLDVYMLNEPLYWYEKIEIPEFQKGYIGRSKFFHNYPLSAMGLYLNTSKPLLKNKEIRLGLQYATNYQKVIDFDLRGDFTRLRCFSDGYGNLAKPSLHARLFSPQKAREHFAKAGFTRSGPDGILINDQNQRLSITITCRQSPLVKIYMQRLVEEAKKCGLEYKIDALDGTAMFQKATRKEHEIAQIAWGTTPPFPDHYQHFHSSEAYEADGVTPKANTNNMTVFSNPEMDRLALAQRGASTLEDYQKATWAMDQIIHDEAIWIPGFDSNFYRIAYWRWVKWPEKTFNVRISSTPYEGHVLWIDEEEKIETEKARSDDRELPQIDELIRPQDSEKSESENSAS